MKKLILALISVSMLYGCNSGGTATSTGSSATTCPPDAPLFTTELGNELINQWGVNAYYYSPAGAGGYTDPYIGAAYFTLVQYLPNAVLLPTVSPVTRVGIQDIYSYFTTFLAENPIMTNYPITGGTTLADCGVGVISGYYNFSLQPAGEEVTEVEARYTFQFQYLPTADFASITVIGGPESGTVISTTQQPGWYIMLQNSAELPQ